MGGSADSSGDFSMMFEAAFARLQVTVLEACEEALDWPEKVALGMRAGLAFAAADPTAAQALTNEALANGVEGIARYERLITYLGERLYPGRHERREERELPASPSARWPVVFSRLSRSGSIRGEQGSSPSSPRRQSNSSLLLTSEPETLGT